MPGVTAFRPPTAFFKRQESRPAKSKAADKPKKVEYGNNWYQQTREAAQPRRTAREEMGEAGRGRGPGGGVVKELARAYILHTHLHAPTKHS